MVSRILAEVTNDPTYSLLSPDDERDEPVGECPCCGEAYFDEGEREYHADMECVGGFVGRYQS